MRAASACDGQVSAADIDSLDLPGIHTIRVANDEFAVKNRLLHDEPETKFLVYRSGQVPSGIGDWLLDLELAYGVFTADRTALVAQDLGLVGKGIDEVAIDTATGKTVVRVDPRYFRPTEVETLLGDATKARTKLGWTPRTDFAGLVKEMAAHDLERAKKFALVRNAGYDVHVNRE